MDNAVHIFNDELQSLLMSKPPVSKGKMGQITKAAMKGVKFYKHIVQIVEKFIGRCRPEYKVPGLYVIDSIVRQSRHQFGPDRDVYASRFARNLGITFENLFTDCLDEDRSRIVRVLNLWLKNGVFDLPTIRPLLDMADPNKVPSFPRDPKSPSSGETNGSNNKDYTSTQRYGSAAASDKTLKFTKNMLDFDYGEDDDDDADETPTEAEPPLSSTLSKIEMEQRVKHAINENSSEARNSLRSKEALNTSVGHQSSLARSHSNTKASSNQDPVLERWNRILKGEITADQDLSIATSDHHTTRRSRSRSPPSAGGDKLPQITFQSHKSSDDTHKSNSATNEKAESKPISKVSEKTKPSSDPEKDSERERRCLPKIRDKHLTICSSTLWLGHVPKTVSEADISDAFGEFGTINSIDLIPPRGCAYVCMDRRQDAKRALSHSKRLKLNGTHIRMAWAPGKGLKEQKRWKDFWESDIGASFIPYSKIEVETLDFDALEEGGVIDEDSMSMEMRERREKGPNQPDGGEPSSGGEKSQMSLHADNLAATTAISMFNQLPPSSVGMPSYAIPPPPLNLGIPPPMLLAQGLMRFPPPPTTALANSSASTIQPLLPQSTTSALNENSDQERPYNIIDRKLSMVEQQLSMLQAHQGLNQQVQLGGPPPAPSQPLFYQMNQPDPMVFDFRHPQQNMMHLIPNQMMDSSQMNMFDGQHQHNPLIAQPPMLPFNHHQHPNMADMSNMDDNYITQTNQDY